MKQTLVAFGLRGFFFNKIGKTTMEIVLFKQEFPGDTAVLIFAKGYLLASGNWSHGGLADFFWGFYTAVFTLVDEDVKVIEAEIVTPEGFCITDHDTPGMSLTEWAEIIIQNGFSHIGHRDSTNDWKEAIT